MECPYSINCDVCGHKNEEICNTCPLMGQHIECEYLDTAGMDKPVECKECKHYNNGIIASGATPVFGWFAEKIKKLFKK
jgi:hypothetical protein